MNEDQIERAAERMMTAADADFIAGRSDQEEYDRRVQAIDLWASEQHNRRSRLDARPHIFDQPAYSAYPLTDPDRPEAYP